MIQQNTTATYWASGKLMLLGEYLVLNGADCLAFPLKFGQSLAVTKSSAIFWESYSKQGRWFFTSMHEDFTITDTNNVEVATILQQLFRTIRQEKPTLDFHQNFKAEANFELNWGLGSSATLISLLSQWSGVEAQKLSHVSFGGSGYDVACATAKSPILYAQGKIKQEVQLPNSLTDNFLFVYLGKKQNSREEIKRFQQAAVTQAQVEAMNTIVAQVLATDKLEELEQQLDLSEQLISSIIGQERLKQSLFSDYPYSIKSLGAWGGDFFLATHRNLQTAKAYFQAKGYSVFFTYSELAK